MGQLDACVSRDDELAELAEAVEEGDHGLVKPAVLEHTCDGKIT